jgi:hypothetical protein
MYGLQTVGLQAFEKFVTETGHLQPQLFRHHETATILLVDTACKGKDD